MVYVDSQIKKPRSIFRIGLVLLTSEVKSLKEFIKHGLRLSDLFIKISMNS